jgi:hypothetical protein
MFIVFAIIVAVVIGCAAAGAWIRHGRRRLRASFGSEYETVIREHDTSREVDRELRRRKSQHDELVLTRFSAQDREFYADSWKNLQGGFPENPVLSLSGAGQLVAEVIEARGYPGDDPQEQLALLSVEHADALPDYRAAQQISRHARADAASTPTEEMRQAMLSYHVLFAEMLGEPAASASAR